MLLYIVTRYGYNNQILFCVSSITIRYVPVWIQLNVAFMFSVFRLFFPLRVNSNITWFYCAGDKKHCSCIVHRSHNTIHIFKNYFATVFSVFSFSKNKFNPNGPYVSYFLFHIVEYTCVNEILNWIIIKKKSEL